MGYKLTKKLNELKKQSQEEKLAKLNLVRTTFLSLIALFFLAYLLAPEANKKETWTKAAERAFLERYDWLENSYFSFSSGKTYQAFAENLITTFPSVNSTDEVDTSWYSPSGWSVSFARVIVGGLLRLSFIVLAFWPLWIFAIVAGLIFAIKFMRPKAGKDILGICDPGRTPFYSGIYGPLYPNHSISGMDYSSPGLACPAQCKKQIALNHKLVSILKKYSAFNNTTLALTRIILAYADYPCFVEDEHRPEEEDRGLDAEVKSSNTNFVTNEAGTIEQNSINCLPAILSAHQLLVSYYRDQEKSEQKIPSFAEFVKIRDEIGKNLPPLGKILLGTLTRKRSRALAKLSPQIVATAYLSLEAGKTLTYEAVQGKFTCSSHYPNLQSRAVLLSLPEFHEDFNGDARLIMRQAILCSRRHRDFGRAFLPMRMPIESRALRDWLEILYVPEERREDQGKFVELDAHLEEIQSDWRKNLSEKLKALNSNQNDKLKGLPALWKGVPCKSVVLMPLHSVISIALEFTENTRIDRITELTHHAAKFTDIVSVSARLPGFKRQIGANLISIEQCGEVAKKIAKEKDGQKLMQRWFIVQRMLTRYNWLSTRVGDDAVPDDGLVQVLFLAEKTGSKNPKYIEAAIPIRMRRFKESFGPRWESTFYSDAPHPNEIDAYVNPSEFYEQKELLLTERSGQNAA